jgi:hypothetical protein
LRPLRIYKSYENSPIPAAALQKHQQNLQRLVPQPRLLLSLLAKLAPVGNAILVATFP